MSRGGHGGAVATERVLNQQGHPQCKGSVTHCSALPKVPPLQSNNPDNDSNLDRIIRPLQIIPGNFMRKLSIRCRLTIESKRLRVETNVMKGNRHNKDESIFIILETP